LKRGLRLLLGDYGTRVPKRLAPAGEALERALDGAGSLLGCVSLHEDPPPG